MPLPAAHYPPTSTIHNPEHLLIYLQAVVEEREPADTWSAWWNAHHEELWRWLPVGLFFRLKQHGPGVADYVLDDYGHPYTQPTPPEPEPCAEDICPPCGGYITDHQSYMTWHGPDGGGAMYLGTCRTCDVDLRQSFGRGELGDWSLYAPEANEPVEPLRPGELEEFGQVASSNPRCKEQWDEFIRRTRAGDEFWRYLRSDARELPTPVARVRGSMPVAQLSAIANVLLIPPPPPSEEELHRKAERANGEVRERVRRERRQERIRQRMEAFVAERESLRLARKNQE